MECVNNRCNRHSGCNIYSCNGHKKGTKQTHTNCRVVTNDPLFRLFKKCISRAHKSTRGDLIWSNSTKCIEIVQKTIYDLLTIGTFEFSKIATTNLILGNIEQCKRRNFHFATAI